MEKVILFPTELQNEISLVKQHRSYQNEVLVGKKCEKKEKVYFSGTYIDEREAPIPGVPCRTGLLVIANSPV